MADVARLAGVSPATVSRALSGTRPMSPDLRTAVTDAAHQLGYRVNLVGRTLRKQRSSTVGLVVPDLDNPFFSSLAQHLSRTFAPSGFDLLVFSADRDLATELRGVQSFIGRQVDALIVIPCDEVGSRQSLAYATPAVVTVQLDRRVEPIQAHFIGCDNLRGMQLVAQHVTDAVDLRKQPLVFVGGDLTSSSGHERLEGFRHEFGTTPRVLTGTFDASWGIRAADEIIASGVHTATIVSAADVIALGLLTQLQARGYRVPEDFRVIGFDGIGVSHLAHPTLTTIRQPVEAMSQAILDIVIAGPGEDTTNAGTTRLAPELVVGASSPAGVP